MKFRLAVIIPLVILLGTLLTVVLVFRPRYTPVERGRRLAEANGCFGCHGPEGIRGTANPGRPEGKVPDYEGSLMMYASGEDEVREWIRDGRTQSRRDSKSWQADRQSGILRMPAYGERLSAREIEDLVSFVMATAGLPPPEDSLALLGRDRAAALGCTGCHGMGGRFARANPGSFKGYVPPWDGPDFPELVRNRAEFGEWVELGVSERFRRDALARLFLRRPPLKMPAYAKHLEPGDVDALWAYVQWLRARPARAD